MAKSSGPDIGALIGWGIAGVGVWWFGSAMGWWSSLFGTTTAAVTTTTTSAGIVPSTAPVGTTQATVKMQGSVSLVANNALKALFVINGAPPISVAVIPGGDAYDGNGNDITAQLAAEGVTPAQLYSIMSAAYTAPAAAKTTITSTTTGGGSSTNTGATGRAGSAAKRTVTPVTQSGGTSPLSGFISQFTVLAAAYAAAPPGSQSGLAASMRALAAEIKALGGKVPSNSLGLSGIGIGGPMVFANNRNYVRRFH
jgi:hypothetical protein